MEYKIEEEYVKLIGRTYSYKGIRWCGLSGSGIAFVVRGKSASVVLAGDDTTQGKTTEGPARVGIYVDGKRIHDVIMKNPEETYELFSSSTEKEVHIQIIKLSECAMSIMGIKCIQTDGSIHREIDKNRKIEFIGDSITCGYGVDLEDPNTSFRTDTEDVTKAYAYKIAKKLNADYSMVSYSGYGVYSGYATNGVRSEKERVPLYYESIGFSYARPLGELDLNKQKWDFSQFTPDLIVINLGTNDNAYCNGVKEREIAFQKEYIQFLRCIRKNNPLAKILCILGLMREGLNDRMKAAVLDYQDQFHDQEIFYLLLKEQCMEDGRVSDFHPTEYTHEKTAELVCTYINKLMS